MRLKAEPILGFGSDDAEPPIKIVRQYRAEYKTTDAILNRQPVILDLVHDDLAKLSQAKSSAGRTADVTSENLFRAILVMQREGFDYREASVRIAESQTLQNFCRLIKKRTIDYTLLNKAFCAIRPETWEKINHLLGISAVADESISIDDLRTDTTVTECNIHWPTDASLLWDTYRVIARELSRAREAAPWLVPWRFHAKKIKRLADDIARYSKSRSKKRLRKVRRWTETLITRVEKAVEHAGQFVDATAGTGCLELMASRVVLAGYLPSMGKVVNVARRRVFDGEKVPLADKVFSIFEPHTERIMRGRRGRPIEFGHKILLTQSKEKFITDYLTLEENQTDDKLLPLVLDRHQEVYGRRPETIAADKGFCPDNDAYEELQDEVAFLGMPRRTSDFGDQLMRVWQHWRAGIEGTISCLKRAFRLARCCFRGFSNFASAVGSAVFCHNLRILAKASGG